MSDDFENQEWLKLGVAGAMARQYAADSRTFLTNLADMLSRAFPDATNVAWRGGLFSRKTLCGVSVDMGEWRYSIQDPGRGPLSAERTRIVRGIALKTEQMAARDWLDELGAALDERARLSADARNALEQFVR